MSEVKFTIPFDGKTDKEVNTTGVFMSLSWLSIKKLIEPAVDLDEDEKITGLVVSSEGVKVRID